MSKKKKFLIVILVGIILAAAGVGFAFFKFSQVQNLVDYTIGGESFQAITGVVGPRKVTSIHTSIENGVTTKSYLYHTENAQEDMRKYETYLLSEGGFAPIYGKMEGGNGNVQYGKQSEESGKILYITIEFTPFNYTVSIQKGEGYLAAVNG